MKKTISLFSLIMLLATNFMPLVSFANEGETSIADEEFLDGEVTIVNETLVDNKVSLSGEALVADGILENDEAPLVDQMLEGRDSATEAKNLTEDVFESNNSNNIAISSDDESTVPDRCYKLKDNGEIEWLNVSSSCFPKEHVKLPEGITKVGWRGICNPATEQNPWTGTFYGVKSIELPNSVTEIPEGAFFGCSDLETIILGNGVKTIGNQAFKGSSIHSIDLKNVEEIGEQVFEGLTLNSVTNNGNNQIKIGARAFVNSTISNIDLKNVSEIGDQAFEGVSGLTSAKFSGSDDGVLIKTRAFVNLNNNGVPANIELSNVKTSYEYTVSYGDNETRIADYSVPFMGANIGNLTIVGGTIGSRMFFNSSINSIKLDNIDAIGEQGFYNIDGLTSLNITGNTEGTTTISNLAFSNSQNHDAVIENVNITNVASFGEDSFAKSKIGSLTVTGGVFGSRAFFNSEINSIKLSDVGDLGMQSFYNISGLQLVDVDGSESGASIGEMAFGMSPATGSKDGNVNFYFGKNIVYIGSGAFQLSNANNITISGATWNDSCKDDGEDHIYNYCGTEIADYAFNTTKSLNSVTFGEGVTKIGSHAFVGSQVGEIIVEGSEEYGTTINQNAFYSANKITIGTGVTTLGDSAFRGTKITEISIPGTVKEIPAYAFVGINTLTGVYIGYGVEKIGSGAFNGMSSIQSVVIEGSDAGTIIDKGAFLNDVNLTNLKLGYGIKEIGEGAFQLTNIDNLEIPGSEQGCVIKNEAFLNSKIENLILGSGVTELNEDAFGGLTKLETLVIEGSNNGTSIGVRAFNNAKNLKSITLGYGVDEIKDQAFVNVPKLESVIISGSKNGITIGSEAFLGNSISELKLGNVKSIGNAAFANNASGDDLIVTVNSFDIDFGVDAMTYNHEKPIRFMTPLDVSSLSDEKKEYFKNAGVVFIQGRVINYTNEGKVLLSGVFLVDTEYVIPQGLYKTGYELLGWKELGATDLFDFNGAKVDIDRTFNSVWRSLEKKSEENNDNNVTYLKTTTVTVGNGEVVEDMNIDETSYIELVATDELPEEIFTDNSKTAIKDSEIKSSSNAEVEYQGGVEVYIELTTNQVTEKKERIPGTAKFSVPVAVKVPVSSNKGEVRIKVKHEGGEFGYDGLTLNPVNICENGVAVEDKYNGEGVRVVNNNGERYATIYTCSASTFVAYTEKGIVYPSAGGGRTIVSTPTTTEKEHNSADINEQTENTKTNEGTTNQIELNEKLLSMKLTRGEVAVMTNILLDVFPQLVEGKQELNDVENACSNYADAQKFTKSEKKAITRLCKLSIMGIHAETKKPLDEFMVKDFAKNNEFATVIDRSISTYNEKDLTAVKDALKKLENNEETVEFGTLYNVFMTVKNLLS